MLFIFETMLVGLFRWIHLASGHRCVLGLVVLIMMLLNVTLKIKLYISLLVAPRLSLHFTMSRPGIRCIKWMQFWFWNIRGVQVGVLRSLQELGHIRPGCAYYMLHTSWYFNSQLVVSLFIYLGFYIIFNTVQVISQWVVLWVEETSTYSWSRFCLETTDQRQATTSFPT